MKMMKESKIDPVTPILKEDRPARFVLSILLASGRALRFSTISCIRSPCMDYHANQKKELGRPQNRQGQRLQGMSIGIDILLSQKNLKVSRHVHEDETNCEQDPLEP